VRVPSKTKTSCSGRSSRVGTYLARAASIGPSSAAIVLDTVGWEIPNSSPIAAWARLRRRYISTTVTALPRSRQAGRPPPPLVVTPAALRRAISSAACVSVSPVVAYILATVLLSGVLCSRSSEIGGPLRRTRSRRDLCHIIPAGCSASNCLDARGPAAVIISRAVHRHPFE